MKSEPSYTAAGTKGSPLAGPTVDSSQPSPLDITELGRVFNSAILSSRASRIRKSQSAPLPGLREVLGSPAYQAILTAVRLHARSEGLSEKDAAERIIESFRRLDELWLESVFLEGLGKLKSRGSENS